MRDEFTKNLSIAINKELKDRNIKDDVKDNIENNVIDIMKFIGINEHMFNIIIHNDNSVQLEYVMDKESVNIGPLLSLINDKLKSSDIVEAYIASRRILKAMGFDFRCTDYDYKKGKELYSDEENNKIILNTRDFIQLEIIKK